MVLEALAELVDDALAYSGKGQVLELDQLTRAFPSNLFWRKLARMKAFPTFAAPWDLPLSLAFCTCIAWIQPAAAQTAPTSSQPSATVAALPQATAPTPPVLSVSLPPGARLRLDIDAHDQELLGVVKSLLDGFDAGGANLQSIIPRPASPNSATPAAASRDLDSAAVLQLLSDAGLSKLLGGVTHLRAVVFETPRPRRTATRSAPSALGSAPSVIGYYEQAYLNTEGGHRIARADFDEE